MKRFLQSCLTAEREGLNFSTHQRQKPVICGYVVSALVRKPKDATYIEVHVYFKSLFNLLQHFPLIAEGWRKIEIPKPIDSTGCETTYDDNRSDIRRHDSCFGVKRVLQISREPGDDEHEQVCQDVEERKWVYQQPAESSSGVLGPPGLAFECKGIEAPCNEESGAHDDWNLELADADYISGIMATNFLLQSWRSLTVC